VDVLTIINKNGISASQVKTVNGRLETEDISEHCQNPWDPDCQSSNIELYLLYKNKKIPICKSCWLKIADSRKKWQIK
jgi:hypothetical protein